MPWGHQVRILDSVKDAKQREWYIRQAVQSGWVRNVLVHQMESSLFDQPGHALINFDKTLPAPQSDLAQQLIRDPYNFDFLTFGRDVQERDWERSLIEHVRDFMWELGKGFAFVGSQYHLEIGDQHFFLDLLFYHLRLRCYVVIDLSPVDDLLPRSEDQPSLGLSIFHFIWLSGPWPGVAEMTSGQSRQETSARS